MIVRQYFQGWRRKAGCIALLLACVFAYWWARSCFITDVLCIREKNRYLDAQLLEFTSFFGSDQVHVVASSESHLLWLRRKDRNPNEPFYTRDVASGDILDRLIPQANVGKPLVVMIPFRAIVMPLILISAYLLLIQPRKPSSIPAK